MIVAAPVGARERSAATNLEALRKKRATAAEPVWAESEIDPPGIATMVITLAAPIGAEAARDRMAVDASAIEARRASTDIESRLNYTQVDFRPAQRNWTNVSFQ